MRNLISNQNQIQTLLSQRKTMMKQRNRKIKLKRALLQLYPKSIERQYIRKLNSFAIDLINATKEIFFPLLPSIEFEANLMRPTSDNIKLDFADKIAQAMLKLQTSFENKWTKTRIQNLVTEIGESLSFFNKQQVTKVLSGILGIDIFLTEPYLASEMKAFLSSNVSLINTISGRHFNDIENIAFKGARQGLRHENIRKEIQARFETTKNNAKRLARDQVNKFNGQLTKIRQQNVGVEKYIWRTVKDERVRSFHASREGKIYSWSSPPSDGHPGEPIQCRCWAEPTLENFI